MFLSVVVVVSTTAPKNVESIVLLSHYLSKYWTLYGNVDFMDLM